MNLNMETATFAGGCFWCTEAIFKRLKGVHNVTSGYAGGTTEKPSYQQVSDESTGHAECVQITFDPAIISYKQLLEVFFKLHDPTTVNQQGNDVGTQYRSVIFYHSDEQKDTAERVKKEIEESGIYTDAIVTEIIPFIHFYTAEDYHQNYYDKNKNYPYCQVVIDPKIKKLYKEFSPLIKKQDQD